jgi:hypothetical protein
MKRAVLILCLLFASLFANAEQRYNPYVNQGSVSPAPLLPVEFNGTGLLSFTVGNSGTSALPYIKNQEMTLIITLSNGVPDNEDPMAAMAGTWSSYFDWTYDTSIATYRGIQNQKISENAAGNITISYKIIKNTLLSSASNGFNVNLQPPPYANGIQATDDDAASIYTYALARDYGDAPLAYGEASHNININKSNGAYTQYVHLGAGVDSEAEYQESGKADGDQNGIDDEDGVIFPSIIQGATIDIPVEVTVHDSGFGFLNAWIDWNGDGDFDDEEEQIITEKFISASGIINYAVSVPGNAISTQPTFARFRIGDHPESLGANAFGEVEDYQIIIKETPNLLTEMSLTHLADKDHSGTISLNDIMTYTVIVTNISAESLKNVVVDGLFISFREEETPCTILTSETSCTFNGTYIVTQDDIDVGQITNIVIGHSDEMKPVEVELITPVEQGF